MKKKINFEDENFIKYLEQHLKEEIEKEYDISYDEIVVLKEEEQDKIFNNIQKTKKFTK